MLNFKKARLVDWPKEIDTKEVDKRFGSPTWIVREEQLIANVKAFEKFTGSCERIYFPVKTNPSLTILQVLAKLGVGADCASRSEIDLALYSGITIEKISYNSPIQDVSICKKLLLLGGTVVMDDIDAVLDLQNRLAEKEIKGKLFIRLNLLDSISYSNDISNKELMDHGNKSSKFGVPIEKIDYFLKLIKLPISGLHVHVGTQMDTLKPFEFAIKELNSLADKLNKQGKEISLINIGGGLGIPFNNQDIFPSIEDWCNYLVKFKNESFKYFIEPGHALVGNAVVLLTKVKAIKKARGKRWALIDVGTDQLAKITLLRWHHRILDEFGSCLPEGEDSIAGPLCFAGDTLQDNISVSSIRKGSCLLITEVGAYTYSLSNKFNGRLEPKWVLLNSDNVYFQMVNRELNYDGFQLNNFEWTSSKSNFKCNDLAQEDLFNLSSPYLRDFCKEDSFLFEKATQIDENSYEFIAKPITIVDFISMPLAIRIFGDATIISILHNYGYKNKDISLWGRKLTLDYFGNLKSDRVLKFTVNLSATNIFESKQIIVTKFRTSCNKCCGTFIVTF